ncbi:hypothetical protein NPIL_519121 [Nephila pilipes]|uniref:Uncharacterized protein n=1 Tax=Nephila pilipes TaxID=299642 RepID=A0A8X6PU27_NEPPI|nr:hypothetical protein NPIL_22251 [Nephila pilipes]GFU29920.1 hypothetical protein NPIL_519121 [Nephila pilipes]
MFLGLKKKYNAHMGGNDLMDSFIGQYHIKIKSRMWTRLFYHLLDMTERNDWIMHKKISIMKGKSQDIMKKFYPQLTYVTIELERKSYGFEK